MPDPATHHTLTNPTAGCPTGYACLACRTPAPACDMPDGCGAREGEPCAPYCPGTAADPNVLIVSLAETGAGPTCITRCAVCTAEGRYPRLTADAALRLVVEHREHVREATR